MASQTLWRERCVESDTPAVYSTVTCNYSRRNSNDMYIEVIVDEHCNSSGAWRHNRWAIDVTVNGTRLATNKEIKARTYGTIGTTNYRAVVNGTVRVGSATSVNVTVHYYDTGYGTSLYDNFSTQSATLTNIPSMPSCSISANQSYPNKTENSIKVNYSVSGSSDYVTFYVNGKSKGNFRSSPANITGLSANTSYKITARAHGSAGYGNESNALNIKTYITPSKVSSATVGNIEPFTVTAYMKSSNANNTSKYEYALCNSRKQVVKGAFSVGTSYYNFTGLNEETAYYIRCRVQSKDSGAWSGYVYSALFKTPADQVRFWAKINNSWNKGKMYLKKDGQWIKAKKAYVKINGQWVLAINKYD